jgi:hypothetical protein
MIGFSLAPEKSYKKECQEKTAPLRLNVGLFSAFSPTIGRVLRLLSPVVPISLS